jgi:hypothetical protein
MYFLQGAFFCAHFYVYDSISLIKKGKNKPVELCGVDTGLPVKSEDDNDARR